jgi:hypothetical protein
VGSARSTTAGARGPPLTGTRALRRPDPFRIAPARLMESEGACVSRAPINMSPRRT